MRSQETGKGMPDQKTPDRDKEEIKEKITTWIRKRMENINIGSYTADKDYDGGYGEDLFDEPINLPEVLSEIEKMIDLSFVENWPRESFIQKLLQINFTFDYDDYKNLDDFHAFRREEEPLDEFIDVEKIADMRY